jgi:hypothetical protein
MSQWNKFPGSYIGFNRVSASDGASGVWNLKQVYTENTNYEWINQSIYYNPCDSMTGWSNNGVYSSNGNFYVGGNSYCYIEPIAGQNLLYSTLLFDVYIPTNSAVAVNFMCATTGQGPYLKFDTRAGKYTGVSYSRGWTQVGGELTSGPVTPVNTWFNVRIRMYNSARIDWFTENQYRDFQPVLNNGTNIGFWGYGLGGYIDNVTIKRGII